MLHRGERGECLVGHRHPFVEFGAGQAHLTVEHTAGNGAQVPLIADEAERRGQDASQALLCSELVVLVHQALHGFAQQAVLATEVVVHQAVVHASLGSDIAHRDRPWADFTEQFRGSSDECLLGGRAASASLACAHCPAVA